MLLTINEVPQDPIEPGVERFNCRFLELDPTFPGMPCPEMSQTTSTVAEVVRPPGNLLKHESIRSFIRAARSGAISSRVWPHRSIRGLRAELIPG